MRFCHFLPGLLILLWMSPAAAGVSPQVDRQEPETGVLHFTLEEAVNRALQANRSIANAVDQVRQSRFSVVSSMAEFELKIIPEVYLDVSKGRKDYGAGLALEKKLSTGTNLMIGPSFRRIDGDVETGMNVVLSQPLFRGLSRDYNLLGAKQSEFLLRSSQRDLYLTQVNIVLSTVSAVYNVIRTREILRLQQSSYDRLLGYAEAAGVKQKMGLASAIDVYRAKIKLKQAESLLITSREALQDALDSLRIILALPLEQNVDVSAPLTYSLVEVKSSEAVDVSIRERVEIHQIRDLIANMELQTKAARHALLPDVDLSLSYSSVGTGSNISRSLKSNKGGLALGLSTSGSVSRTREKAAYEQSRIAVKSAGRLLSLKQDEVKREVKFYIRSLNRTGKNIDIQREQITQAKGKLELAKVKFSRGMAGNFDMIEAETELRTAEINLISAVIQYIEGRYCLKAAMGTLIDKQGKVAS